VQLTVTVVRQVVATNFITRVLHFARHFVLEIKKTLIGVLGQFFTLLIYHGSFGACAPKWPTIAFARFMDTTKNNGILY
jgi:hypothetical protein